MLGGFAAVSLGDLNREVGLTTDGIGPQLTRARLNMYATRQEYVIQTARISLGLYFMEPFARTYCERWRHRAYNGVDWDGSKLASTHPSCHWRCLAASFYVPNFLIHLTLPHYAP